MSAIDTERFRELLTEERGRVQTALDGLQHQYPRSLEEEGEESGSETHPGDMGTETFDRELDLTLEDNEHAVLERIDAALQRIEDRTYGVCRVCGKQIPPERLEAMPWVDLCIDDQRKLERG